MRKLWLSSIVMFALFLMFPLQGLAVEYSITNVKIDAYLLEDGKVEVEETHTYAFEGEFNGITREVVPKEGSSISNFTAEENGKSLRIEKEDDLYKIHRKGNDETITVALHYTIKNGIEVYEDVAQFYWPFFDDRNESSYENLKITIHPPGETDNVIAFGYDEAYGTETIQEDGTVLYKLGNVPSSTNGDIRVAYPSSLFSTAPVTSEKTMKDEILQAKQDLDAKSAAMAETRETLSTVAAIGLPVFTAIVLLLMMKDWLRARRKRSALMSEGYTFKTIPQHIMSMPATIFFTNRGYLPPQAMAAGLLDLVRQEYVAHASKDRFQLTGKKSKLKHEKVLMSGLFKTIGTNGEFSFDDLTTFTKNSKNHSKYNSFQTDWQQAIREEVKVHSLYEKKGKYRLIVGLSSLLLLPFLILFPIYELVGSFFATLLLFCTVIIYAISYRPKTMEGAQILNDWKLFRARFKELTEEDWGKWSKDEQMRAYIYGLGVKDKRFIEKNEELVEAFTPPYDRGSESAGFYYIGYVASKNFHDANQSTASSSGGSSSSGGGTGGGGGGSGAF